MVAALLGLLVSPQWLLGVPVGAAAAAAVALALDLDRSLRAVDDGGDPGAGPAGLHP